MDPVVLAAVNKVRTAVTRVAEPSSSLTPWHAALANRENAPATILIVTDSTGEGVGINSIAGRYIEQLRDKLRKRFPVSDVVIGGAADYIPAYYDTSSGIATNGPVFSGSVTKATTFGLGRRCAAIGNVPPGSITFNLPSCTRFKLLVAANVPNSIANVQVDGGTAVDIPITQTNTGGTVAFDSGTLARGDHTLVVKKTDGTSLTVEGVLRYDNDFNKGIRVIDCAHSGNAVSHYAGDVAGWGRSAAVEPPDLVIQGLGYNDYMNTQNAANYQTGLTTIQNSLRNLFPTKSPSFLYLSLPKPRKATVPYEDWPAYVAAMRNVVAADPLKLSQHLDLSAIIPEFSTSPKNGFGIAQTDDIHPTVRGNAWIADNIMRAITLIGQ